MSTSPAPSGRACGPKPCRIEALGGDAKKSAIPNPHRGGGQNVLKITNLGHFFLWKAVSWLTLAEIDPKSINDDAGFRRFTRLRRGRGNRAPDDQTQGHVVLAIASRTCGFPARGQGRSLGKRTDVVRLYRSRFWYAWVALAIGDLRGWG